MHYSTLYCTLVCSTVLKLYCTVLFFTVCLSIFPKWVGEIILNMEGIIPATWVLLWITVKKKYKIKHYGCLTQCTRHHWNATQVNRLSVFHLDFRQKSKVNLTWTLWGLETCWILNVSGATVVVCWSVVWITRETLLQIYATLYCVTYNNSDNDGCGLHL